MGFAARVRRNTVTGRFETLTCGSLQLDIRADHGKDEFEEFIYSLYVPSDILTWSAVVGTLVVKLYDSMCCLVVLELMCKARVLNCAIVIYDGLVLVESQRIPKRQSTQIVLLSSPIPNL